MSVGSPGGQRRHLPQRPVSIHRLDQSNRADCLLPRDDQSNVSSKRDTSTRLPSAWVPCRLDAAAQIVLLHNHSQAPETYSHPTTNQRRVCSAALIATSTFTRINLAQTQTVTVVCGIPPPAGLASPCPHLDSAFIDRATRQSDTLIVRGCVVSATLLRRIYQPTLARNHDLPHIDGKRHHALQGAA